MRREDSNTDELLETELHAKVFCKNTLFEPEQNAIIRM